MPDTIPTKFDPTDLPAWARNDPAIVAFAKRDIAFRTEIHDAGDSEQLRKLARRTAHRIADELANR